MPGPCSIPRGVIRPKANITKRTLKRIAVKTRVPRSLLDPSTGRPKPREAVKIGKK